MFPSGFGPRRTSRLDTPMVGSSTRTGGDGGRGRRVGAGVASLVVAGLVVLTTGEAGGDASGRAGACPHAPRARASVSDASPAATRWSAGTPAQQHAGTDPGHGQHGRTGQNHGDAGDGPGGSG